MSDQNNDSFAQQPEVRPERASEQPSIPHEEAPTPTSSQNPLATIDPGQLQCFVNLLRAQDVVRTEQQNRAEYQKKFRLPEPYDTKDWHNFRDWTEAMEDYFRANTNTIPTDKEKVGLAANRLKGNIRRMWSKTPDNEKYTWDQFKDFLRDRIEAPRHRKFNATKRFSQTHQKRGQQVNDFLTTYLSLLYELQDFDASFEPTIYHCEHWINMFILKLLPEIQNELLSRTTEFATISEAATEATQIEEKLRRDQQWTTAKPNRKRPADEQASIYKRQKFPTKNRTERQASDSTDQRPDNKKTKQGKEGKRNRGPPGPCHCGGNHWFNDCPHKERNKGNITEKQEKSFT